MPASHPPLIKVRYPAMADDTPDHEPIQVSVPWNVLNANTVVLGDRLMTYPPLPNVRLIHINAGVDNAVEIRADAVAENICHLSLRRPTPHTLSLMSPSGTSLTETIELIWHGILAPAAAPGFVGVDWADVSEVLRSGSQGAIDWIEWDTRTEFALPHRRYGTEDVTGALAVLIAQNPPMAAITRLLGTLRSAFPSEVLLIPAAPFCEGRQCGVVLLLMLAGHGNPPQTLSATLS